MRDSVTAVDVTRFAAAGVIIAATVLGISVLSCRRASVDSRIQPLLSAVAGTARPVEPRLMGGFAWTALAPPTRGGKEVDDLPRLKLDGAAGVVIERSAQDQTAAGRHAVATARLLARQPYESLDALSAIPDSAKTAAIWNDLAAAHYVIAVAEDAPESIQDALSAVDAALRLAPGAPEALFNRALIIEHLGLREAARRAWRKYLEEDGTSSWSGEAYDHLHRLSGIHPDFRRELDVAYPGLASGDEGAANQIVQRFPQESRAWGEALILGKWGESATRAGETEAAKQHLAVARALGVALRARSGEGLLSDVVEAIQSADAPSRAIAAEAFVVNWRGRLAYQANQLGAAETSLRHAAELFDRARNPMKLVARYYLANTIFDQYRTEEARTLLDAVDAVTPPTYRALRAEVAWEKGLCENAVGHTGRAAELFSSSLQGFQSLGESQNAAFQHGLLSDVSERLGDFRTAWRERLAAIAPLSEGSDPFRATISGLTRVAALAQDWTAAASLGDLEREYANPAAPDDLYVDTLIRGALIAARRDDPASARRSLADAASALRHPFEAAVAERLHADYDFASTVVSASNGSSDIEHLTKALAFHSQKGRRLLLPELFLARSRRFRALGDRRAAWNDLVQGINELESERKASTGGHERSAIFDTSRELFTDAVSMRLSEGDDRGALLYSDWFRGRVLLDQVGSRPTGRTATMPADMALVEFLLLPDGVVTFVADSNGIRHVQSRTTGASIRQEERAFTDAVRNVDSNLTRVMGSRLYSELFEPLKILIGQRKTLVLIPDAGMQGVPYPALFDPRAQKYLIQQYALTVAPSASAFQDEEARVRPHDSMHLLVVGDPNRSASEALGNADAEAREVAALYPSVTLLRGDGATRKEFLTASTGADVIHFAGHGTAPISGTDPALLFTPEASDDGRLYASDIATLRLPRPRLVVLAACSTAAGRREGGEGPWSVARAFLSASVPTVVATLWAVDDRLSRDFFVRVHEQLRKGASPAEGVRVAQMESIDRGVPVQFWAAVRVNGSP